MARHSYSWAWCPDCQAVWQPSGVGPSWWQAHDAWTPPGQDFVSARCPEHLEASEETRTPFPVAYACLGCNCTTVSRSTPRCPHCGGIMDRLSTDEEAFLHLDAARTPFGDDVDLLEMPEHLRRLDSRPLAEGHTGAGPNRAPIRSRPN